MGIGTASLGYNAPEEAIANARAGGMEVPEAFWSDLEPLIRDWDIDRGKRIIYR